MKRVFCCLMAALVLFGTVGCAASVAPVAPDATPETASATPQPQPDDVIVFDDDALEAYIRTAIGKPNGDITRADAEAVSELEAVRLVRDLIAAERSPYCPHGRPTRIRLDQTALERLFHRS